MYIIHKNFFLSIFCLYVYSTGITVHVKDTTYYHPCMIGWLKKKIFWCVWNKPSLPQTLMKRKLVDITLLFCFLCIPFVNFCPPTCRYPYHSSSEQYIDLPRCSFLNTHQKQLTIIHKMLQVYLFLEMYISDSHNVLLCFTHVYWKSCF